MKTSSLADINGHQSSLGFRGINLLGFLTAELGIGEMARGYTKAIQSLGLPLALTDCVKATQSRKLDKTFSD